ncbi:cellulase family glycosylhydrolase [Halomicrococcus gelatinilyticus]|uniref:cellulase family glycosylhydrolase n=1 Tax=Halomicrococcus gelatinilyticus TaxID=1702103 RepID=UPI002E140615
MNGRTSRRGFLVKGIGASAGGLLTAGTVRDAGDERARTPREGTGTNGARRTAGSTGEGTTNDVLPDEFDTNAPVDVRGAIYVPTRAFNRYQMWHDYDPDVTERDLGYAERLNLNAIRTWMSYQYWLQDPEGHEQALEHFLDTADDYGLRVVLGLHDSIGLEPTYENLVQDDLLKGVHTFSPATRTMLNENLWEKPREYVRWFMRRYSDDDRLLAIELTNEPGWNRKDMRFMEEMAKTLTVYRGDVPLTVGSTSLANNTHFLEWGMDILQFHYNFANTPAQYRRMLRQANHVITKMDKPVWLSEWQRIRPGDGFFANLDDGSAVPDYSSLAPLIQKAGIGNFFWSLMLKPAYSAKLRRQGVINGIFHEDGSVWSRDDAKAIKAMSGDASFDGPERQEYPEWAAEVKPSRRGVDAPDGPRPR